MALAPRAFAPKPVLAILLLGLTVECAGAPSVSSFRTGIHLHVPAGTWSDAALQHERSREQAALLQSTAKARGAPGPAPMAAPSPGPAPGPAAKVPKIFASTALTKVSKKGSKVLHVNSLTDFQVDQNVIIDFGTPIQEANQIAKFGSIILKKPLKFDHPSGAKIWATSPPKAMQVVEHDKHPSGGYKRGSPLYEKQESLVAKTPVSTTMRCIINLIAQFFLVYTTLFFTQIINRARPSTLPRLEKCLLCVQKTVYMIPMLCVLFLATRLRAIQLTKGMTEKYDLPQPWVKSAMTTVVVAHMLRTAVYAVYYALHNKDPDDKTVGAAVTEKILQAAIYLITAVHHFGFLVVCIGLWTMSPPKELWGKNGAPETTIAILCTILLTMLFFAVHFCIELVKTLDELTTPGGKRFGNLASQSSLFREMHNTVDVVPILCLLFLGAHIRSLQLSGMDTSGPLPMSKTSFYLATGSVFALVFLHILMAVILRKEEQPADAEANSGAPDGVEATPSASLSKRAKGADVLRTLLLVILYCSSIVIIISVFTQERKNGPTPALPSSIECLMVLTALYFVFYSTWLTALLIRRFQLLPRASSSVSNFANFLEKRAKEAIDFCPILCVLFLGTFMRAHQITNGQGAPQRWAQDWMYVATTALIFMTIARIDDFLFKTVLDPATGTAKIPKATIFFYLLQIASMLFLHCAVISIIYAVFTMTPQNARGRGSISNI